MSLPRLLAAQAAYGVVGIAYNVINLVLRQRGQQPLSDAPATAGIAAPVAYELTLLLAVVGADHAYRLAMVVAVLVLGYGGIVVHLTRGPTDYYLSTWTWTVAITVNSAGVALNLLGAVRGAGTTTNTTDGIARWCNWSGATKGARCQPPLRPLITSRPGRCAHAGFAAE